MILKVKLLYPDAKLPVKAHPTDVGFDCYIHSIKVENGYIHYGLGIAIELDDPDWFVAIVPRSSQTKDSAVLGNSIGIVDPTYRGELGFRTRPVGFFLEDKQEKRKEREKNGEPEIIHAIFPLFRNYPEMDQRICQLIILPKPSVYVEKVDELSDTQRGTGGFGSTGR